MKYVSSAFSGETGSENDTFKFTCEIAKRQRFVGSHFSKHGIHEQLCTK